MEEPSGIPNVGNTCYMASALQCIFNVPELTNTLKETESESELVHNYLKLAKKSNKRSMLGFIYSLTMFPVNRQHDSHDFLVNLLEKFHSEIKYTINVKYKTNPTGLNKLAIDSWIKFFNKDYSEIVKLFYGQYHYQTKCMNCSNKTHKFEPHCTVTLPIPDLPGHIKLSDCISEFQKPECIVKYNCDNCGIKDISATRKSSFANLPEYLIIHLNRFKYTRNTTDCFWRIVKNSDLVEIPLKLELRNSKYELESSINHIGGTTSGHYISFIKKENVWYLCNDSSVSKIEGTEKEISENAYVLFYRRTETNAMTKMN